MARELWQKLGIKAGYKILLWDAPVYYAELLGEYPDGVEMMDSPEGSADMVHVFVTEEDTLWAYLDQVKKILPKKGMLWVSWPKGGSKIPTTINRDRVRELGLSSGLVDVKVCSVNEDWSGLKFVYRLADR